MNKIIGGFHAEAVAGNTSRCFSNREIEEGVAFAKNYEHGLKIEVREDGTLVEEIKK